MIFCFCFLLQFYSFILLGILFFNLFNSFICETIHSFCQRATSVLDISEACSTQQRERRKKLSTSKRCFVQFETKKIVCCEYFTKCFYFYFFNDLKLTVCHIMHLYGQTHVRVTCNQQTKRKQDIISTTSANLFSHLKKINSPSNIYSNKS